MSESSRPVTVHAWVDIACPWCWIAKRRFEEAAAEFGREVVVDYHSWELAPDLPESWVSSEVVFLQHLYAGTTAEDAAQKISAVRMTGVRLGLAYDFDAVQHTNTFRAHQLVHHAKAQGRAPRRSTRCSRRSPTGPAARGAEACFGGFQPGLT